MPTLSSSLQTYSLVPHAIQKFFRRKKQQKQNDVQNKNNESRSCNCDPEMIQYERALTLFKQRIAHQNRQNFILENHYCNINNMMMMSSNSSGSDCIVAQLKSTHQVSRINRFVIDSKLKMIQMDHQISLLDHCSSDDNVNARRHIVQYKRTLAHFSTRKKHTVVYVEMEHCKHGTLFELIRSMNENFGGNSGGSPTATELSPVRVTSDGNCRGRNESRSRYRDSSRNYFLEGQLSVIVRHVLLGLRYVHDELQTCYKNLSLKNVLIGDDYQFKLKEVDLMTNENYSLIDRSPWNIGGMYKLAPEVSKNGSFSKKSDIWSLGVLLWELCLQGLPIWFSLDSRSTYRKIKQGKHLSRIELKDLFTCKSFSPCLLDFLGLCMRFQENERASTSELLNHRFITKYSSVKSQHFVPSLLDSQ